jgi:hypothetical protein
VQSVVAGTSNTAGVNFSINGSQGTGTGAGGSLLFRTAPAGSSGTTQNALGTALAITAAGNVGIGTTAPSTKLHVEDATSPTLTIKNTSATGYSQVLLANTVVPGSGFWVNGSAQLNYGGASSFNIYAAASNIAFHTATVTNALSIAQNGTSTHAGNLIFAPDNTYDIGASGASRPRNVYVGSTVQASAYQVTGSGINALGHNGVAITLGSNTWKTQVESTMLCFSGNTSSFPAIKRVGTDFQVVNAGTTAALNVAAPDADLTFIEDRFRRKGAGTPEAAVTAPIGAVYHRTDGGAGTSFYVKESGTGNTGWVGK